MKNKRLIIASILLAVILAAFAISVRYQDRCKCVQFRKYTEVTINPDATIKSRTDSICIVSGNRKGQMFLKRLD